MFGKLHVYSYVVDRLDNEKAAIIRKSLEALQDVKNVAVNVSRGQVQVKAKRDLESQVRMACDIAKADFRTKVKE
jgi:hypothetical protein